MNVFKNINLTTNISNLIIRLYIHLDTSNRRTGTRFIKFIALKINQIILLDFS